MHRASHGTHGRAEGRQLDPGWVYALAENHCVALASGGARQGASRIQVFACGMVSSPRRETEIELAFACFCVAESVRPIEDAVLCGDSGGQGGGRPFTADPPNLHVSPGYGGAPNARKVFDTLGLPSQ